jgi:hypothetical protein
MAYTEQRHMPQNRGSAMIVIRNTYPRWPAIKSAEPGDEVEWRVGCGKWLLTRKSDGAVVFSRDCLPKHEEDTRPMVGLIAAVRSKGWFLEVSVNAAICLKTEDRPCPPL